MGQNQYTIMAHQSRQNAGPTVSWGGLGGRDGEVHCVTWQVSRARRREQRYRKGFFSFLFLSFKELLFHGLLKSHYKDYRVANNVRQISI